MNNPHFPTVSWKSLASEGVWLIYVLVLSALTIAESLNHPETKPLDRVLDIAVLLTAFGGAIASCWLSARILLRRATLREQTFVAGRLGASWFLGPTLGFALCLFLNSTFKGDVDGGLLLCYLPVLAVFAPAFVLPFVMRTWSYRKTAVAEEHANRIR